MVEMVRMENYKLADGGYDWAAYNRARVAAGEKCRKCDGFIIFSKGYPTTCHDCEAMETDKGEVRHSDSVRCPKCRHVMEVHGSELYALYEEGEHEVSCQECNHDFEVSTRVSYTFCSPELIDESAESEGAKL